MGTFAHLKAKKRVVVVLKDDARLHEGRGTAVLAMK
jgi:hypothetical protein